MIFQELDKWMLDIEEKENPTPKERRLHVKLGSIRNDTYLRYLKAFDESLNNNQRPAPIHCRERAMPPSLRRVLEFAEACGKVFGGDL